jgi:RNA-directed DNA polymerase
MKHRKPPFREVEPLTDERRPATPARKQQPGAGADSDGVDVDGMAGSDVEITWETCPGGPQGPTAAASPATDESRTPEAGVGAADSSVDLWESITHGEQSGSACNQATKRSKGAGDGSAKAGIRTPESKIRKLQIALYRKAKAEPEWRFYSLYGELCRKEVLKEALRQVKANKGRGGVDGVEVEDPAKHPGGEEAWLQELAEELRAKTYRAAAVLRKYIQKADGKQRPLGIPTVRDRVVQTALSMVLMPIYEADFHPHSYGYRPKRSAGQAMKAIKEELWKGRTEIVDADLSGYFDNIDHRRLLRQVRKRVADGSVIKLVKMWLRAPIVEVKADGTRTVIGNRRGTPQGGVISPLLANIYLNDLDHGSNEGTGGAGRVWCGTQTIS